MGQLIIKYTTDGNPGFQELQLSISLSRGEMNRVKGLPIEEVAIDGQIFSPKLEDSIAKK